MNWNLTQKRSSGFTLIELAVVIVLATSMGAMIGPSLKEVRSQGRAMSSEGNLWTIGQASAMYAMDNDNRIASYSWRGGETYINLANGTGFIPSSDADAAAYQARDILYRATGRTDGSFCILVPSSRLVHRRYSHLILADYMGSVSERVWVDPNDFNQAVWQDFPTFYEFVPYGQGQPSSAGYDNSSSWTSSSIKQMWGFGSSYQTIPHAWMGDSLPSYVPISDTPHLFLSAGGTPHLGDRYQSEVAFPSSKVYMFEEFDRERVGAPYFAYGYTNPAKLMFDGSINTMVTRAANDSVSPINFTSGSTWTQRYLPIDKFPVPVGGLGDQTELNMHYRWTLNGLQGIDYPQPMPKVFSR